MQEKIQQYDVVIVGGGMVGLSLAVALGNESISVLLIEQHSNAPLHANSLDLRTTGLARSSMQFFAELGLGNQLENCATAIERLEISEKGGFGCARIDGHENRVSPIGHMAPNHELIALLSDAVLNNANITTLSPAKLVGLDETANGYDLAIAQADKSLAISTSLLIGADGARSKVRELLNMGVRDKDYQQTAIITNIQCEVAHDNIAFERFTKDGPLAVLPVQDDMCALIWTHKPERAEQLLDLSDAAFIQSLQEAFGFRLGRILAVGKRVSYPLSLTISEEVCCGNAVLVGNAAQSIHPVAAQGFNLGLRDVHTLVHMLREIKFDTSQYSRVLSEYQQHREQDRKHVIRLTDGLTALFAARLWPLKTLRSCGIRFLSSSKLLQRQFLQRNLGTQHLFSNEG